jgi:hypothetical protein
MVDKSMARKGDSLHKSTVPLSTTVVDNSGGTYPTEDWEATYFSTSRRGALTAHRVTVRVPEGLGDVCPRIRIGQPGCVYGVRRWGFALRPSALAALDFDPDSLLAKGSDSEFLHALFHAAAFELPGEFVIASPEHPFRLTDASGMLRGSGVQWRTYLGALAFFASGGKVDAAFVRFWAEAQESYQQAVDTCLAVLNAEAPA